MPRPKNLPGYDALKQNDSDLEAEKTMQVVLIADRDEGTRRMIAESFKGSDFQIVEADTIDAVLRDVLKDKAQIILLGSDFDGLKAMEIIPLLKQCNRDLIIILVSNEESLALLRRLRREGIFYHALKPVSSDDQAELMQVIKCAFHNAQERRLLSRLKNREYL